MNNNHHFFKHLAPALHEKLAGLELLTCFSQEKDELMLGFGDENRGFFIKCSVLPTHPGFYFTDVFHRAKKNSVDLWPELVNTKVASVKVFEGERAFAIYLNDKKTIVFKMFGNRANIILFEEDKAAFVFNNTLKQDLQLRLSEFHKERPQTFNDFKKADGDVFKIFPTWGKIPQKLLKEQKTGVLNADWKRVQSISEQMDAGLFYLIKINDILHLSLLPYLEPIKTFKEPISAANAYFIDKMQVSQLSSEKGKIRRAILKSIKSCEQYIAQGEKRLDQIILTTSNQDIGHILMANLHAIPPLAESVELLDFVNNNPIKIKLKKDLSGQKNAENYYRKAKKEKIEIDFLEKNIAQRQKELETLLANLKEIEEESSLKTLRKFAKTEDLEKSQKSEKSIDELFKCFEVDGYKILVGKNSKNNDVLTQKFASKNDLWLHAKDVSGSHVVIKDKSGHKTPPYIIEKAAELAAWFSKRKTDSLVPVMCTPKKFVRKIKGSLPGQVVVDKEDVILVTPKDPSGF
ncbi:MAG: putative ribosome quality control (RQC) complex YloA/Tae2 family protein [Arcticibacterium sp.]|jgi:predicted ribosome quality control (RQC) complex YloA/Tae2 family protein